MFTLKYYELENSLDSFATLSVFRNAGMNPVNDFKELPRLVKKYKRRINEESNKQVGELLELAGDNENYTHNIVLPDGDYYNLTWDVPKALKLIDKHKLVPTLFSVEMLSSCIAPGAVNHDTLDASYENTNPIIIVELPTNMLLREAYPFIIIDGNHRLAVKIKKGEQEIKGYFLNKEIQPDAFSSNLDHVLYKVHYNKHIIVDYLFGNISKRKLKNQLISI